MNIWRFIEPANRTGIELAHNTQFVFLMSFILVVAIFGAYGMIKASSRISSKYSRGLNIAWHGVAASSMAFGTWSMHFMAMVLYGLPAQTNYHVVITAISILPILAGSWIAVYFLNLDSQNKFALPFAALAIATGIGFMHFVGMEAIQIEGAQLYYDFTIFAFSIVLAVILALASVFSAAKLKDSRIEFVSKFSIPISSAMLGLTPFIVHHVALTAAAFHVPLEQPIAPPEGLPLGLLISLTVAVFLIVGSILVGILIDERLSKISESLKQSEIRGRLIVNSMLDGLVVINYQGIIEAANPAACSMFAYSREELLGKNVKILMDDSHSKSHDTYLQDFLKTGESSILGKTEGTVLYGRDKAGGIFPLNIKLSQLKTGNREHFVAYIQDLRELHESEQLRNILGVAVEKAADAIVILNTDKTIEYVNPMFTETLGYSFEEVIGKTQIEVGLTDEKDEILQEMWSAMEEEDKIWSGYVRSWHKGGYLLDEEITLSPVSKPDGSITHYVQIRRDVSNRLKIEAQLHQAQRLESVGLLAAGIAHEINTPAQYVGDNMHFLGDSFEDLQKFHAGLSKLMGKDAKQVQVAKIKALRDEQDVEYLMGEIPRSIKDSLEGIAQVTKIVSAMKEFSHPGGDRKLVDINRTIESTTTVSINEWKYVASIEQNLDTTMPLVPCYPGELKQVLLQIIVNAAQAITEVVREDIDGKGLITIDTGVVGDSAEIRIRDTGTGIEKSIRDKIFDPFFSTRNMGEGTGQGLTMAYNSIVEKHGGSIDVESEVGVGSCFIIRLPLDLDLFQEQDKSASSIISDIELF